MSGIAELLVNLGYVVSGSDARASEVTSRLETLGIGVRIGHAASHVGEADVVVVSSAVAQANPEVLEAGRRAIPVIARAEMLGELMRLRYSVAVAGAHGKTTTTSMIALVLERAGLDPTAVIGGRLKAFGSNARLGRGDVMVAEADESDRSFLRLFPTIAVVTNIDHEHLEAYDSFEALRQAFVDFANHVPFYGVVIACADDVHVAAAVPRITRRLVTYGMAHGDADLVATDVVEGPMSVSARVTIRDRAKRSAHRESRFSRLNPKLERFLQVAVEASKDFPRRLQHQFLHRFEPTNLWRFPDAFPNLRVRKVPFFPIQKKCFRQLKARETKSVVGKSRLLRAILPK